MQPEVLTSVVLKERAARGRIMSSFNALKHPNHDASNSGQLEQVGYQYNPVHCQ